jgi:hypothetical protein
VPSGPEELIRSFYTKRKKGVMEFGFGDSVFCDSVENEGKKGARGAVRPRCVYRPVEAVGKVVK